MKKGKKKLVELGIVAVILVVGILFYTFYPKKSANVENTQRAEIGTTNRPSELSNETLDTMQLVAENEYIKLYLDYATTQIAVKSLSDGKIWYSNPVDLADDTIASGNNIARLKSQFSIEYSDPKDNKLEWDNFTGCISKEQFEIKYIENGIRIEYGFGDAGSHVPLPVAVLKESFEEKIISSLNEEDKELLEKNYKLISLNSNALDAKKELWKKTYPGIETHDIYELSAKIPDYKKKKLLEVMEKTAYSFDDMNLDYEAIGIEAEESDKASFFIPLEYTLEGENLVVNVPTKEIEYSETFPIISITLLENFGASREGKEGYFVVPDGSGAIIDFDNKRTSGRAYTIKMYGEDLTKYISEKLVQSEQAHLPIFGSKQQDDAFFAIIEDGDSVASLDVNVSGTKNNYNSISPKFILRNYDKIAIKTDGNSTKNKYQENLIQSDLKIKYAFLNNEDANYVGMAKYYQRYLVEKGVLSKKEYDSQLPFYLEVVGAIDKLKTIVGMPAHVQTALTSYEDTKQMVSELLNDDVKNIKLKYTGWQKGGILQGMAGDLKLSSTLGGKKEFKELLSYLNENHITIYPDVDFAYVYKNSRFDNFIDTRDAARFISGDVALLFPYNLAYYAQDFMTSKVYNIVKPTKIQENIKDFLMEYKKYSMNGISVGLLGNDINSDYKKGNNIDREQAKKLIEEDFKLLAEDQRNVMAEGGNAVSLGYLSDILNIPTESGNDKMIEKSIPFYQMVIHGYIQYAGDPLNVSDDYRKELLKTIETGSGLYVRWMKEENSVIKDTEYDNLYSAQYDPWYNEIVDFYQVCNEKLGDTQGQLIVNHEMVQPNVTMTEFEQGKTIIVNYNSEAVTVNGIRIEALDYIVTEGEKK